MIACNIKHAMQRNNSNVLIWYVGLSKNIGSLADGDFILRHISLTM